LLLQIFESHDTRIINQHIQRRVLRCDLIHKGADVRRVFDVERERFHARALFGCFVESLLAPAGDDDLIP
jgi:hypothetical protein